MKTYEGKKEKRARVNFTQRQLEALEKVFESAQYPDVAVLEELSKRMHLPVEKICTWFQNRRSKFRKGSKSGHIEWMRSQLFTTEIQAPTSSLKTKKEKASKPSSSVLAKDASEKPDSDVPSKKIHSPPASQPSKQPLPPYSQSPAQNYYTNEQYKATNKYYEYPTYQGNGSQNYLQDQTHGYPANLEQPSIYNTIPSTGYSINETPSDHLSDLQFPPGPDFVLPVTTAPQSLGTTAYTPTTLPQSGLAYDAKLNNVCSTMSSSYPATSVEYIPSLTTMNSAGSTMVTPSYNSYSSYQGTISTGVNFNHLNPTTFGADSAYSYTGTPGGSSAHQSQYGNYGQFSCGSNTYQPQENFSVNQLPQNTQLTSL